MKLCKMIEIYLKYDNMDTVGIINTFIFINNHVNSWINSMLSHSEVDKFHKLGKARLRVYMDPRKVYHER